LKIDSSLKIIVLTGFGTISSAVNAVKLGAINFLTKPIDADGILSAFKQKNIENETQIQTPHLAQVEWEHIQRVMQEHDGNISKASKALGLHRRSLQRKLGKNPFKIS
jgi:two-component system, response regulator RegA